VNPRALTLRTAGGGITRVLITNVHVHITGTHQFLPIDAIWDTGATGTAITTKVVERLGLIPTGMATVSTANGMALQNTHTVDIGLPNGVIIKGIVATQVDALLGADALIGMDIITLGDFSITNFKGNTCMSFRMPSLHELDYTRK